MPGGIWDAIGAALQQGTATYSGLKQQQLANEQRQKQLDAENAFRQAQLANQQKEFEAAEAFRNRQLTDAENDRKFKQLQFAIEGILPNEPVSPELLKRATDAGLGDRFQTNPTVKPGVSAPIPGMFGAFPGVEFGQEATRKPTLEESLAIKKAGEPDKQRRIMESVIGSLPPGAQQRALVSTFLPGVGANEVFGPLKAPSTGSGETPNLDALAQAAISDPNVLKSLRPQMREKVIPRMQALGYDFKPQTDSPYQDERRQRIVGFVDDLIKDVGPLTVGMGSYLSGIPGSKAKSFSARMKTLTSNIAFEELAEMRANSKTGGALGQISNQEENMLGGALAALDTAQSEDDVRTQLQQVKDSIMRYETEKARQAGGVAVDPKTLGAPLTAKPNGTKPAMSNGAPKIGRFEIVGSK